MVTPQRTISSRGEYVATIAVSEMKQANQKRSPWVKNETVARLITRLYTNVGRVRNQLVEVVVVNPVLQKGKSW